MIFTDISTGKNELKNVFVKAPLISAGTLFHQRFPAAWAYGDFYNGIKTLFREIIIVHQLYNLVYIALAPSL
jgi:hypothetical protein